MPIIPGDQLTDDQKKRVFAAFPFLDQDWQPDREWLAERAFHFTRKGELIVERGVYLRLRGGTSEGR